MAEPSVSLRDYCDVRFEATDTHIGLIDRRVTELDKSRASALDIAQEALNSRLNTMNEFRGSLNDLAQHAATRDQLEATKDKFDGTIAVLRERLGDVKTQVTVIAALVSLLISMIMTLISRWLFK